MLFLFAQNADETNQQFSLKFQEIGFNLGRLNLNNI